MSFAPARRPEPAGEGILHRPGHGRDRREDAGRAGEGLHQEVEVGDAPLDERHPGVVEEELDVFPSPGGEVIDDGDVVMPYQGSLHSNR